MNIRLGSRNLADLLSRLSMYRELWTRLTRQVSAGVIKALRVASMVAAALSVVFLVVSVVFGLRADKEAEAFFKQPQALEVLKAVAASHSDQQNEASALIKEAEALALRFNPPPPEPKQEELQPTPVDIAPKFELKGTCFYPNKPERSLALINEPGKGMHWVKQAATVDRFSIEQIFDGRIVIRDGRNTQEMVAPRPPTISLVKTDLPPLSIERKSTSAEVKTSLSTEQLKGQSSQPNAIPVVKTDLSPEQLKENIAWLKQMMEDPQSMGLGSEEAKNLNEVGSMLKSLEDELHQLEQGEEPNEPNLQKLTSQ